MQRQALVEPILKDYGDKSKMPCPTLDSEIDQALDRALDPNVVKSRFRLVDVLKLERSRRTITRYVDIGLPVIMIAAVLICAGRSLFIWLRHLPSPWPSGGQQFIAGALLTALLLALLWRVSALPQNQLYNNVPVNGLIADEMFKKDWWRSADAIQELSAQGCGQFLESDIDALLRCLFLCFLYDLG